MLKQLLIGEHTYFATCRFCGSEKMESVINLGNIPLAGGFFKKDTPKEAFLREKFYPLDICFCPDCYLLQVNSSINPDTLFKEYFYFSSSIKTLVTHFQKSAQDLTTLLPAQKKTFVVEIGSNDGSFIAALLANGFSALGVDPATNVVKSIVDKKLQIRNDYFTEQVAKDIVKKHGPADAIMSFHSMAHIEDMHDVLNGVKALLKKDGFLAFEVHYLGDLMAEVQYDMMYHEHQFYYSLLALQNFFARFAMEVFDVKVTPVRAGSMMFYVQNKKTGKRPVTKAVKKLMKKEKKQKLHKKETYTAFSQYINSKRRKLLTLLDEIRRQGQTVAGYGASGRGTILMNYCGLNQSYLDYVIDDAPAKQGSFTPGTHHKIVSSAVLTTKNRPDYTLLFAWPFLEEIRQKNSKYLESGGKFIVPLPSVRVINR